MAISGDDGAVNDDMIAVMAPHFLEFAERVMTTAVGIIIRK